MILLVLAGCGCPSFEEMRLEVEIEDDGEGLSADRVRLHVEHGIADFVAWTAREGVCIERITAREEVTTLAWDGIVEVNGWHSATARAIEVSSEATLPERVVVHELCHALDHAEDIAATHPDLFPVEAVPQDTVYSTHALRASEAFAQACDDTPDDLTVLRAAGEACGEDFLTDHQRFFDEVVYPGFPEAAEVGPGEPIGPVEWREVATFEEEGRRLVGLGGDDLGLVYLVDTQRPLALGAARVVRMVHQDPVSGAVVRVRELPFGDAGEFQFAKLVPTDEGTTLVYHEGTRELLDPETGEPLLVIDDYVGLILATAVVDGVFYLATQSGAVPMRAWDLASGAELDVPTEGLELESGGLAVVPTQLVPVEGALEAKVGSVWARLEDGAWFTWDTPTEARSGIDVGEGERAFLAYTPVAKVQLVTLDVATGAWGVRPRCEDRDDLDPMLGLVRAAGRPWLVRREHQDGADALHLAALDLGGE